MKTTAKKQLETVKAYHHGSVKEEALGIALTLIEEVGLSGFSMRDLAKQIGISHVSLYHHFGSKEDLVNELAAAGFKHLSEDLEKAVSSNKSGNWHEQVLAMARAFVRFGLENSGFYHVMYSPARDTSQASPETQLHGDRTTEQMMVVLAIGKQNHEFTCAPDILGAALFSLLHGIVELQNAKRLNFIINENHFDQLIEFSVLSLVCSKEK